MGLTERYRRPSDLPQELPLFPLTGAILLPRATLPLNVFEPRYLALIEDAIASARVIGIIQPDTHDESESPAGNSVPLRRIGCAGRISAFQEMDDNRLVISLAGVARFETTHELETGKPYRTFAVSYNRFAQDFASGAGEDRVDRPNLLRVLKTYLEANRLKADWHAVERATSESLINILSVTCPYGPEEKQALLEAADLKTRADVLIALAEMELASGGESGSTLQ